MQVEERGWFSDALAQDMVLKVYGHAGRPIVAFPSQDGRYWDFEAWGMVEACAGFIDAGRMRLIAVEVSTGRRGRITASHPPIGADGTTPTTATSPTRSPRSFAS